jgi:hypothetical protein
MKNQFQIIILLVGLSSNVFSQNSFDCEIHNEQLVKFCISQFSDTPNDGAKYVTLNSCKYIIGVGTTSSQSKSESIKSRIASVKARREVLLLLNQSTITSESILSTEEIIINNSISYIEKFRDEITEKSSAFISGMPLLTSFESNDGKTFIYILFKAI